MQQARRLIALPKSLVSAELVDPLSRVNNSFAYPAKADLSVLTLRDREGLPAAVIEARTG